MSFCRIIITSIHIINTGVVERNPRRNSQQVSKDNTQEQINPGQVSENEQRNQISENFKSSRQSTTTQKVQSIPSSSSK